MQNLMSMWDASDSRGVYLQSMLVDPFAGSSNGMAACFSQFVIFSVADSDMTSSPFAHPGTACPSHLSKLSTALGRELLLVERSDS